VPANSAAAPNGKASLELSRRHPQGGVRAFVEIRELAVTIQKYLRHPDGRARGGRLLASPAKLLPSKVDSAV
jgi:hypothetical protein